MILVTAHFVIQTDQYARFAQACETFSAAARQFQGVNRNTCLFHRRHQVFADIGRGRQKVGASRDSPMVRDPR
jgi:hypothetical protein